MNLLTQMNFQIFRNRGRSILLFLITALLIGSTAFYVGNIQSTQTALQNLADHIPVKLLVVNHNGSSATGLRIDAAHRDALDTDLIKDLQVTARAAGAWDFSLTEQPPFQGGDTHIVAVNNGNALSGLDNLTLADEISLSFFSEDSPRCLASAAYTEMTDSGIGDSFTIALYSAANSEFGIAYKPLGEVTLEVAGTFENSGSTSLFVPEKWLRNLVEENEMEMIYDSATGVAADPQNLNSLKAYLVHSGYMEPFAEADDMTTGDAISVEDELFIKTAREMKLTLGMFERFAPMFFSLLVVLVALVMFLILRSDRKAIAIESSIGQKKRDTVLYRLCSIMAVNLAACIIALPILAIAAKIPVITGLAICVAYLLVSCAGTLLALFMLLRFRTLDLLTKTD